MYMCILLGKPAKAVSIVNRLLKVLYYQRSSLTVYRGLVDTSEPQQLGSHCW